MSLRIFQRQWAQKGTLPSSRPLRTFVSPGPLCFSQSFNQWSLNLLKRLGRSRSASKREDEYKVDSATSELDDPQKRREFAARNYQSGAENSIFQDEIDGVSTPEQQLQTRANSTPMPAREQKTLANMALVTDPDPRSRTRWQRKKIIQMVRKGGQLSREERIRMSEREMLHKSHHLPTSVKKLVMLSRQIAGKRLDDAIIQMQWSKKKMAAEIKYYLEEARDLAVARHGMGLGKVNGEVFNEPRKIRTREGRWIEINDPTRMYVAQSWVGRGPIRGKKLDYKGRGRFGTICHPSTSFTVLIKEEKTRIREYEDEAKKASQGPWVHLPNRPLYGQRPYYTW